jgi:MurNAc alpha-1-phosphate uridylyltransferase
LLGSQPFIVVNGDIWTDYDFARLPTTLGSHLAHLVVVNNPQHNPEGDFGLGDDGLLQDGGDHCYTFSGIGVYQPQLFATVKPGKTPLAPLLRQMMQQGKVSGEHHSGLWTDVGTPERLSQLQQSLTQQE